MKNFTTFTIALVLSLCVSLDSYAQMRVLPLTEQQVQDLLEPDDEFVSFQSSTVNLMNAPLKIDNDRFKSSKTVEIFDVPVILTAASLLTIPFKERFYNTRETYVPNFHQTYDDYTQYLPAAVMLGVKAFGVEGRSSWGRMLAADGLSTLTMVALVNSIKYTAKVQRPGNGAYNAYPSGHTATAFMTATMLHKEYGQVSKWYSIGAYGTATVTSVTRVLNNKHWVSDVLFGAAIGILSTELGYLFSDLIFKERGLNKSYGKSSLSYDKEYRPSFVSLYTSVNAFYDSFKSDGVEVNLKNSGRFGVEGAWYMNKYVGFGGQATISTADIQTVDNQMGMVSGLVGGYFSYPLSDRWRVGSKALVGADFIKQPINRVVEIADYAATVSTGINFSYLTDRNFGFKIFSDYRHHFNLVNSQGSNELNFGVSIDLMFGE